MLTIRHSVGEFFVDLLVRFGVLPWVLLVLHSAWVIFVASIIYSEYEGPGYQQELQTWLVVAAPDMPAALALTLLEPLKRDWLYASTSSHFSHVILPAIEFLILGGLQWWLIGAAITKCKRWLEAEPID